MFRSDADRPPPAPPPLAMVSRAPDRLMRAWVRAPEGTAVLGLGTISRIHTLGGAAWNYVVLLDTGVEATLPPSWVVIQPEGGTVVPLRKPKPARYPGGEGARA